MDISLFQFQQIEDIASGWCKYDDDFIGRICMVSVLIIGFGIPLILMIFAYTNISITLWRSVIAANELKGVKKRYEQILELL